MKGLYVLFRYAIAILWCLCALFVVVTAYAELKEMGWLGDLIILILVFGGYYMYKTS